MTRDPADGVLPGRHHTYEEELIAHVTQGHQCSRAQDYLTTVLNKEVQRRVATTPVAPDGTVAVQLDGGKVVSEREHREVLEALHRDHPHDETLTWAEQIGHAFVVLDPHPEEAMTGG